MATEEEWTDITPDILAACKEMADGEMMHDDTFNLCNAMSGLELMDPKMVCFDLHAASRTSMAAVLLVEL